jgi:hypothetical protein
LQDLQGRLEGVVVEGVVDASQLGGASRPPGSRMPSMAPAACR